MNKPFAVRASVAAVLAALSSPLWAETITTTLDEVVVTAPRMEEPLTVVLDPKMPQQPVPANDGAAFLKNVPGFNVIRKGGTDGDPVLRGLAGSRLPILLDGMDFHGGCNMRMDPPTAYVFPETYDEVTVIKGPQTVAYGNGNSAGVVLFDHDRSTEAPGMSASGSLMAGSWGRLDAVATGQIATDQGSLKATLSHAQSGDYKDGDGTKIHSEYERQSATLLAGWRADANTRIDLDGVFSRGEAAYADRSMDGSKFDRQSYGLTFDKKNLSPLVKGVNARVYHSYIDHVMDNYSLRELVGTASAMNPDRETDGARVSVDLSLNPQNQLKLGADWRREEHSARNGVNYASLVRKTDYKSRFAGVFGELTHDLTENQRLIGGLRLDDWSADRWFVNMMNAQTYQGDASETLKSGFLRFEQDLSGQAKAYVGYGMNQRPMDFWEANRYEGITTNTANVLNPETTHQLDAGLLWKSDRMKGSLSAFFAKVDDYILVYSATQTTTGNSATDLTNCMTNSGFANARYHSMGAGTCVASGNIDATRYGAEADLAYKLTDAMTLRGTLAYVHANNDTMDVPLAQTPPLEAKLGADYKLGAWTYGGVVRMVAKQDRIHPNYGTIVGVDKATTTPGFATLSLNGSYKPSKSALISFGIDNVLDKTYAEHISTGTASIPNYADATGDRVNEPGRFFWGKVNYQFN